MTLSRRPHREEEDPDQALESFPRELAVFSAAYWDGWKLMIFARFLRLRPSHQVPSGPYTRIDFRNSRIQTSDLGLWRTAVPGEPPCLFQVAAYSYSSAGAGQFLRNISMSISFAFESWVASSKKKLDPASGRGFCFFIGGKNRSKVWREILLEHAQEWQAEKWQETEKEQVYFEGRQGPVWIYILKVDREVRHHYGLLKDSEFAQGRELGRNFARAAKDMGLRNVLVCFSQTSQPMEQGIVIGFDLAAYSFKNEKEPVGPSLHLSKNGKALEAELLKDAKSLAFGVNLARHLVNLPPSELNPDSYAKFISQLFSQLPATKVEVWDPKRLEKEKMGLHLAVGRGSEHGSRMVHIKYRPVGAKRKAPIAFVGKGLTFDSGGLDIKPSSGMRLMKKDMGGSAAIVGLAHWALTRGLKVNCDFYLALAENAVDARSFRPGDVYIARNGLSVEIHNTDAEGRLVLADVLDVAITAHDKPEVVVDVATLTGAIKVALGADLPGMFCNHDRLADIFLHTAQASGDPCWRMPLYAKYNSQLNSGFADLVNATDGFGGAITAALFLGKFVGDTPWIHLDIYAWNDRPAGGSGQGVLSLAAFLKQLEKDSRLSFKM
jgi:leucyl aminopeptidase